ncbi:hypothetical protein WAI453_011456 [Rhynchosporium graminicola]
MDSHGVLEARHIQNHSAGGKEIFYWGYASRVMPCTNDAGSCEYLDGVYWMHTVSMLYTFILWAVLGGLLAIFVLSRAVKPSRTRGPRWELEGGASVSPMSIFTRFWKSKTAALRRVLLPEGFQSVFGHVTRLQLVLLAMLLGYLTIFSFVGIVYKTWITPVKALPGKFNTRTGMGGFSDRVGAFAYALTPLSVFLSQRESILSLVTGMPTQSFNFIHRWLGHIIMAQSMIHTIIWTIVEAKLYQPQPKVYNEFIKQTYMIWGIVAMALLSFIWVFSFPRMIRLTGYEFFRKSHALIAVIYFGACWGHWSKLACWMIAALAIVFMDFGIRYLRTLLIHVGYLKSGGYGFVSAQATLQCYDDAEGRVVRIDFEHNHGPWSPGQHFYLCFPELSIWQNHPFTVASVASQDKVNPHHTYIVRCLKGETSKLGMLAERLQAEKLTTPVILSGPYGPSTLSKPGNFLAIAGGTGASMAFPVTLQRVQEYSHIGGIVQLAWIIRRAQDLEWMAPELAILKRHIASAAGKFSVKIFITRELNSRTSKELSSSEDEIKGPTTRTSIAGSNLSSLSDAEPGYEVIWLGDRHPDLSVVVKEFVEAAPEIGGSVSVVGSGPGGMGTSLRKAVAAVNDGSRVWRGEEKYDVHLHWDDRMD